MQVEDEENELQEDSIEKTIVRYVQEHPKAKDTAAGIAKWWLMPESKAISYVQLNKILEKLVTKGVLGKLEISQGEPLFFLDKRMAPADLTKYL